MSASRRPAWYLATMGSMSVAIMWRCSRELVVPLLVRVIGHPIERRRHVHVVDETARRQVEPDRGEVQETADACEDQPVRDALGFGCRHREDGRFDALAA